MIYGALEDRSRSGYLAFCVFLLCPIARLLIDSRRYMPGAYVAVSYFFNFALGVHFPQTKAEGVNAAAQVFMSHQGLILMRFIAFAYTYHYLNWFSKTSIIRWHKVGIPRLAVIGGLWLTAVGTYVYNYSLGDVRELRSMMPGAQRLRVGVGN